MDPTTIAIPFFFLAIGAEAWVGRRRGRRVFRAPDVVTDLSLGVLQALFTALFAWLLVGAYAAVHERFRFFTIPDDDPLAFAALFVAVDFFYYWFHRAAHRVNVFWASHAPHHSSEDYNLAVALRQGPIQPLFSLAFYLPLAVVGFSPRAFALVVGLNTVFQFWIHTELVRRLGPLELVLNTPSHHRVHHGCNGRYIDKNHGGVFIVWDKLFGTFEPEGDRPVYGTVKPVATWNPVKAAILPFLDIYRAARATTRVVDALQIWVRPPEWRWRGAPPVDVVDGPRAKHDARPARATVRYVIASFVVTIVAFVLFLVVGIPAFGPVARGVGAAFFVVSFGALGGILDERPWGRALELARVVVLAPATLALVVLAPAL